MIINRACLFIISGFNESAKVHFFYVVYDIFSPVAKEFGGDLLFLHFQKSIRMKQVKFILLVALLAVAIGLQAQNYIIDVAKDGDSTPLYKPQTTKIVSDPYVVGEGEIVGWLHNGDRVMIAEEDKHYIRSLLPEGKVKCVLVTINGEKYFVSMKDLKFGDNPADVEDWVKENRQSDIPIGKIILWIIVGGVVLLGIYGAMSRSGSSYSGGSSDWNANRRAEEEERRREERDEAARRRREEDEKWYRDQQERINKGKTDLWS